MTTLKKSGEERSRRRVGDRLNLVRELRAIKRQGGKKTIGSLAITVEKKPNFTGSRIRAHWDQQGDLYCIYYWWRTRIDQATVPPRVPPGVTIPGSDVCIFCPPKRGHTCPKTLSVCLVPGIWWDLEIGNIPNCSHCIEGPHYEIIPR
jgi:hypothetical protein